MTAAGLAVPQYHIGTFLIDTGASSTVVDPALIAKVGLQPTGVMLFHTPSTNGIPIQCNQYDAALYFPGNSGTALDSWFVEAVAISEAALAVQGIDGLIGRDLLDRCTLIYNGSNKTCHLAF